MPHHKLNTLKERHGLGAEMAKLWKEKARKQNSTDAEENIA